MDTRESVPYVYRKHKKSERKKKRELLRSITIAKKLQINAKKETKASVS